MDLTILLLANGFILSAIFAVLLILLALNGNRKQARIKTREDLKKIKEQINNPVQFL